MRILLIGDIHGALATLPERLALMRSQFKIGAAICLGDFGFFREIFEGLCPKTWRLPVPLYAIDGNHEDHAWIRLMQERKTVDEWRKKKNLIYQPRGTIATIGESVVGFLGGALHVDRPQVMNAETEISNAVLVKQRKMAAHLFNKHQPDLIVTHSCPAGIGVGMRGEKSFRAGVEAYIIRADYHPGPDDDCGEMELAELWHGLKHKPHAWAFGHFHVFHEREINGTHFVCVPSFDERTIWPVVMWDAEIKEMIVIRNV
jgi:DNA repair exonuclease SbcCD nuclease subunit